MAPRRRAEEPEQRLPDGGTVWTRQLAPGEVFSVPLHGIMDEKDTRNILRLSKARTLGMLMLGGASEVDATRLFIVFPNPRNGLQIQLVDPLRQAGSSAPFLVPILNNETEVLGTSQPASRRFDYGPLVAAEQVAITPQLDKGSVILEDLHPRYPTAVTFALPPGVAPHRQ